MYKVFPKKIVKVNGHDDNVSTDIPIYIIIKKIFDFLFIKWINNIMFSNEKKTTKAWGLISLDCHTRKRLIENKNKAK